MEIMHCLHAINELKCNSKALVYICVASQVLKIWDIPSQQCVKTIQLKFPNLQAGFTPEQGRFPLLLNLTADPVLLVSYREYLAALTLTESNKSKSNDKSGLYTCVLYNPHLEQVGVWVSWINGLWTEHYRFFTVMCILCMVEVITACADSTLTVWDVKTGIKRMEVRNAHGQEEVSCMALDVHQRRLISAATNGTIKASVRFTTNASHNQMF